MTVCWILGASDPEMECIQTRLERVEAHVIYATVDARRVHPGNAYRADAPELPKGIATVYAVECGWEDEGANVVHIDHHRPGDPGFGRPPEEFFAASSIGQVFHALAFAGTPSHEMVLVAAADHCLGAAYRGECPGVDPDELMEWRAASRAKFQGRSVERILEDVASAQQALRQADIITLAPDVCVRDMRCDEPVPELPEAAMRLGISYVSGPLKSPDGRWKFTMSGMPDEVRAFLEVWAPACGLVGLYGDPARGFAGGYAP